MVLTAPAHIPRNLFALGLAIAAHVAMIDYLLHLQYLKMREPEAASLKIHIVADLEKNSEKILPLPLSFAEPDTAIAEPDIEIAVPREAYKPPTVQLVDNLQPHSDEPTIATTGPRPIIDAPNTFPLTAYPASAKRAGQEGAVTLSLQILESGAVYEVQIENSSGYEDLDRAAARYARLHWKFLSGTRNGVPVADWKRVTVVFNLQQIEVRY